jgi:phosphoserine phosphatase
MRPRLSAEGWLPSHRHRLESMLEGLATVAGRKVAVFDWDNTMMRGDIGDLALSVALGQEPERALPVDSPWLSDEARAHLSSAPVAARASVVAHVAYRGTLPDGRPAFAPEQTPAYRGTYGFMAQMLCSGRTDDDVRALGREALALGLRAAVGERMRVHGIEIEGFARLYAPMVELVAALEAVSVECFVVSASPQALVEAVAAEARIPAGRVVGVRFERDAEGRMTGRFARCGDEAPDAPVMSWKEGKRRWIRREIFGVADDAGPAGVEVRPVFGAGDSEGDLPMLDDATHLRLVLDREVACLRARALRDPEGWLLQPPFVDPRPAVAFSGG